MCSMNGPDTSLDLDCWPGLLSQAVLLPHTSGMGLGSIQRTVGYYPNSQDATAEEGVSCFPNS